MEAKTVIQITFADGQKTELSEDEARQLYTKLHEMFGKREKFSAPDPSWRPYPDPIYGPAWYSPSTAPIPMYSPVVCKS